MTRQVKRERNRERSNLERRLQLLRERKATLGLSFDRLYDQSCQS